MQILAVVGNVPPRLVTPGDVRVLKEGSYSDPTPKIEARPPGVERLQLPHLALGFGAVPHRIGSQLMVVLRCTQKLLAHLKRAGDAPPVGSTTRLGDWYGNILRIGHRQHLIFISARSRLPVLIPVKESRRLDVVFPDAVCEVLAAIGVNVTDIASERSQMSEIAFGPTRNRSVLGTLNDFAHMAKSVDKTRTEPESPEDLMRFLAQTPILPLNGANPIDLTLAAFGQR